MAADIPESGIRSRLAALAEYNRPWVGRVGLALVLLLWVLLSAVAFGAGYGLGLTVTVVGGILILGEVWLERSGERHETFSMVWHVSWRVGMGAVLLLTAVVRSDGWGSILFAAVLAGVLVLPRLVLATLWLRGRRENTAAGEA